MNIKFKMIKMKRKKREGEEERKKIRCWWFNMVYNGPAIKWPKQYKKY